MGRAFAVEEFLGLFYRDVEIFLINNRKSCLEDTGYSEC